MGNDVSKGTVLQELDASSDDQSEHETRSDFAVANLKWIGDRKYTDTAYLLPSDNTELQRSRTRHRVYVILFSGHIHAPLGIKLNSGEICDFLEVGCGLGDWCVSVAKDHPNVNVLGIDTLNTFQETERPENCRFEVVNALEFPMPYNDNSFDLIHIECFGLILKDSVQEEFLTEITRLLKPGGYFQWVEPDLEMWNAGPKLRSFDKNIKQMMRLRSLDPHLARKLDKMAKAKGLINVKHTFVSEPLGNWSEANIRDLLTAGNKKATDGFEAIAPLYRASFGLTVEQYNAKKDATIAEMMSSKIYQNVHLIVAGKPLSV